jgi:hypothetical protein
MHRGQYIIYAFGICFVYLQHPCGYPKQDQLIHLAEIKQMANALTSRSRDSRASAQSLVPASPWEAHLPPSCLHAFMPSCLHAFMPSCLHAFIPSHAYTQPSRGEYSLSCPQYLLVVLLGPPACHVPWSCVTLCGWPLQINFRAVLGSRIHHWNYAASSSSAPGQLPASHAACVRLQ